MLQKLTYPYRRVYIRHSRVADNDYAGDVTLLSIFAIFVGLAFGVVLFQSIQIPNLLQAVVEQALFFK